ncbi:hypothetical protein DESAMIL20_1503 [Desulfurella amilsii]|uniref:Uncharacterized protein n=1 Tax=Desulfurella amilsii TaxID=1562698 RepID=A0A1X4XWN2_9BACT|nr:hypothetical protein DESAMIL20_1503 [Desulfurella amilsii]
MGTSRIALGAFSSTSRLPNTGPPSLGVGSKEKMHHKHPRQI